MMKWAVSTVVVVCAGFAAVMTAWEAVQKLEAVQKWLGK
jgi:predicted histidine transporter YuiF (NhaC family)